MATWLAGPQRGVKGGDLVKRPLQWQIATVTGIRAETPRVKVFTLALPD